MNQRALHDLQSCQRLYLGASGLTGRSAAAVQQADFHLGLAAAKDFQVSAAALGEVQGCLKV